MSTETDAIRAQADQIIAETTKIDQQQDVNVVEAVNELESVTIPALQDATVSAQKALDTLKKSLQ